MSEVIALPESPDLPNRLGRHVEHDERSRSFAFAAPQPMPVRDVVWRRLVPAYDQGNLGSCTANALCGALSTRPYRHRFVSQHRTIIPVYSEATRLDTFPGDYPPNDTGSSGLAVAKAALRRGWISRYEHVFAFDALLQALMVGPVIVGTDWHVGMFNAEPDGRVRPIGNTAGGHEYQAFGVDATERRIWFFNSWGTGWGVGGGRFYMTFADFVDLLSNQGDATVLIP